MYIYLKYAGISLCAFILSTSVSNAQDDQTAAVTSLNLALVMPPTIPGLNDNSVALMATKLTNILTNNGLTSDDQDKAFTISPGFQTGVVGKTAGGMRNIYIVPCTFSLFIKQPSTKTVFATYTKVINGTGDTPEQAIEAAVTQISQDENGIGKFFERGKAKIGAYYEANCQQFTANADREIAQGHYDAANAILASIPRESGTCYATAQTKMGDIFTKQYGSLDKAAQTFRQENIINPGDIKATKNLGVLQTIIASRADQDKTPPEITLTTPKPTRGQVIEADVKDNSIYVSGTAKDPSGIAAVTINGKQITNVTPDGFFNTKIGQNEPDIVINATDKKGNMATLTYHVASKTVANTAPATDDIAPIANNEKYHAIFIANSNYTGGSWPALNTTTSEAKSLAKILEDQYNFDPANVDTIFNKNKIDMCKALLKKVSKMGPDDNLIIYYAGHGKFNSTLNLAYWVPLDASEELEYISNSEISDILLSCNARHVLIMADACFSGAMRGGVDAPPQIENISKSRQILASGGTEPVPGVSVYVKSLLEQLNNNKDHFMSVRDLQSRIYPSIKNEGHTECTLQPLMIAGSQGGQFYFKKN